MNIRDALKSLVEGQAIGIDFPRKRKCLWLEDATIKIYDGMGLWSKDYSILLDKDFLESVEWCIHNDWRDNIKRGIRRRKIESAKEHTENLGKLLDDIGEEQ